MAVITGGLRSPVGSPPSPTLGTRLLGPRRQLFLPAPGLGVPCTQWPWRGLTPHLSSTAQRLPPLSALHAPLAGFRTPHDTKMEQWFVANGFGVDIGQLLQLVWPQYFPSGGWEGLGGQSLVQGGTRVGRF